MRAVVAALFVVGGVFAAVATFDSQPGSYSRDHKAAAALSPIGRPPGESRRSSFLTFRAGRR